MEFSALAILGLGFALGLKHATDADHVVAVTTFVSEQRSVWRGLWIGLFWGLGHTLSLTAAGLLVVFLKISIPEWVALRLEFAVAFMLVILGVRVIVHRHEQIRRWHAHFGLRPLAAGMVHGAAGSAALMLLVLSTLPSGWLALFYISVFGAGSLIGMLAISLLLSAPMYWAARHSPNIFNRIQLAAGAFSCAFGLYLGFNLII